MGFHCQSFRFEGGGRHIIGMVIVDMERYCQGLYFNENYQNPLCFGVVLL